MADSLAPTTSTSPAPQQAKRVKIAKPKLGKPEGPGRCHYFVARKNKYCSLIPKTDQYYCGEHAVFVTFPATTAPGDNAAASNATPADRSSGQATAKEADTTTAGAPLTVLPQRVPCPLDPSHTVNLKGLERHMKFRCNARPPETTPAYFREDYNVAGVRHPEPTEGPVVDPRLMHELGDLSSVSFAYRKKSKLYHDLIQNQLGQRVTLPAKAAAEAEAVTAIETEVVAVAGALPATLDQVPPTPAANATGLPPFAKLDWSELSQLAQRASAIYTRQADQFRERHPLPSCPSGTSDSSSTPPLFPTEILDHPALNQRRQQKTAVKHVVQQASLLGQLEKLGLLRPTYQFVEFGAGKGELSTFVQTAFNLPTESASPVPEVAYTLVDRRNFRNKFDREVGHTVRRIQIDIKDLDLAR
ncbi:methyltransferase TRM13-domain-containing protein, partial [Dimargaris cristalligena]